MSDIDNYIRHSNKKIGNDDGKSGNLPQHAPSAEPHPPKKEKSDERKRCIEKIPRKYNLQ